MSRPHQERVDGTVASHGTEAFSLSANGALFLDLFGQQPIAIQRVFVTLMDGVVPGLYLSYLLDVRARAVAQMSKEPADGNAWLAISRQACEEATGLTEDQQDLSRRKLRQRGFVLERRKSTVEYALQLRAITRALLEQSRLTWGDRLSIAAPPITSGDAAG